LKKSGKKILVERGPWGGRSAMGMVYMGRPSGARIGEGGMAAVAGRGAAWSCTVGSQRERRAVEEV
jgi:hypothetical protein